MAKHLISVTDKAAEDLHGLLIDYQAEVGRLDWDLLEVLDQLEKIRGHRKWHS